MEADQEQVSPGEARPTMMLPPSGAIPQDLSMIMDLVNANQVVGSLPPISKSAAEQRRLVELSRKRPDSPEKAESHEIAADVGSDSSSEFESSSEESALESETAAPKEPLTMTSYTDMTAHLDRLINDADTTEVVEEDLNSDDDDEADIPMITFDPASTHKLLASFDDEDGPSIGDPILSANEKDLPPVPQPAMARLPSTEKLSLAGDVVSWMRDRRVEVWVAKEEAKKVGQPMEAASSEVDDAVNETQEQEIQAEGDAVAVDAMLEDGELEIEVQPKVDDSLVESLTGGSPSTAKRLRPDEATPRFDSAGTVVVRAMQSRPGAADDGWLEEGSVVCWEDGRILGAVSLSNSADNLCNNRQDGL